MIYLLLFWVLIILLFALFLHAWLFVLLSSQPKGQPYDDFILRISSPKGFFHFVKTLFTYGLELAIFYYIFIIFANLYFFMNCRYLKYSIKTCYRYYNSLLSGSARAMLGKTCLDTSVVTLEGEVRSLRAFFPGNPSVPIILNMGSYT